MFTKIIITNYAYGRGYDSLHEPEILGTVWVKDCTADDLEKFNDYVSSFDCEEGPTSYDDLIDYLNDNFQVVDCPFEFSTFEIEW